MCLPVTSPHASKRRGRPVKSDRQLGVSRTQFEACLSSDRARSEHGISGSADRWVSGLNGCQLHRLDAASASLDSVPPPHISLSSSQKVARAWDLGSSSLRTGYLKLPVPLWARASNAVTTAS
eukprot:scaffold8307_cov71-Phaeocystis_antarctica.AAC.1